MKRPTNWHQKLLDVGNGPVEVMLHMETGWVVSAVSDGWVGVHGVHAALVRTEQGAPRVWADRDAAMLELETLCPDCYGVDLPAPCATCEGTGRLGVAPERMLTNVNALD